MLEKKDEKTGKSSTKDVEELKLVLSTVSTELPALIRNIIASVFSEEAGRNMGKAAAAFYKELKDGGMPDDKALEMTEDYMRTFTSLGDIVKQVGRGKNLIPERAKERERE
jgi:hypothetical protein